MKNKSQFAVGLGSVAMLLGLVLFAAPVGATEQTAAVRVPLKTMNQAEYEAYREQLRQHEKGVAPDAAKEKTPQADDDANAREDKPKRNGYGKGYRARNGQGGAGGYRGGMMNRGAMRR
ncbi:MAG: hypothetical protein PHQ60_13735 [Sideroxydans sp.]|nr:hypothetical protein [Sideroxydans sp.]